MGAISPLQKWFIDIFQVQLPKFENKTNYTIKALYANGEEKFISIKFKTFYK